MKLAIISDIHDNQVRLGETLLIFKKENIKTCICCGDISSLDIINQLSGQFESVFVALGNMDFNLKNQIELFPENVAVSADFLEMKIDNLKIAIVHHDYKARDLAKEGRYDFVFYGHTHTPWEKKIGQTTILNPGEITGQFGRASFAIFDTKTQRATLRIIN